MPRRRQTTAQAEHSAPPLEAAPVLMACDRENPDKLSGEPLRNLLHSWGLPRSEASRMDDAQLRVQAKHLVMRRFGDD